MATAQQHNEINKESMESPVNGNGHSDHYDHATGLPTKQRKPYATAETLSLTSTRASLSVFLPSVVTSSLVSTSPQPPTSPTRLLSVSVLSL
jgi:hypothetical protein